MKKPKRSEHLKITPEKEDKAREKLSQTPLEKGDIKAFLIAAFISFVIPTILVIGFIALVLWLIFFG